MDIDHRGITTEITAVTPQQATPSPRYYHKFHLQNRGVTAVLPPSPLPCRAPVWTNDRTNAVYNNGFADTDGWQKYALSHRTVTMINSRSCL